jgi:hypothetical protein
VLNIQDLTIQAPLFHGENWPKTGHLKMTKPCSCHVQVSRLAQNCNFQTPQGPVSISPPPRREPLPCHASLRAKVPWGLSSWSQTPKKCCPNPGGLLAPAESKSALSDWKMAKRFCWWDNACSTRLQPNPWPLASVWAQRKHSLPVRNHGCKLELRMA